MGMFKNKRKSAKGNKKDSIHGEYKKVSVRDGNLVLENQDFTRYYKAQKILPEDEWDTFMDRLKEKLPTSFRITGTREQAQDIIDQINRDFIPFIKNLELDGVQVPPPQKIPWYPNDLGWTFEVPKVTLKKSQLLNRFHKFLVTESEIGNISRQEAVSMIPPLLLDVKPHHYVLDMCAAPGSKTAQILELLHFDLPEAEIPDGVVIANDSNYKRACLLVHQTNKLQSPCLIVTNHNGERFPNLYSSHENPEKSKKIKFDRILADVPCSLVYSTCSLNPIENEAIIAETLNYYKGQLELVDVSQELSELKRRPGLSTWKVFDYDGAIVESEQPLKEDSKDQPLAKNVFPASLFPPQNAEELHLDRCGSAASHDDKHTSEMPRESVDILEQTIQQPETKFPLSPEPNEPEEDTKLDISEDSKAKKPKLEGDIIYTGKSHHVPLKDTAYLPHKPRVDPELNENPFIFLNPEEGSLKRVMDYYGLSHEIISGGFLVRAEKNTHRTVYFVSHAVKSLLQNSDNKIRMVNTGIKLFAKPASREPSCEFRLVSEGVPMLVPFVSPKFVIDMTFEDFEKFLFFKNPRFDEFSKQLADRLKATDKQTSLIVRFNPQSQTDGSSGNSLIKSAIVLPVWRGHDSISIHIDKNQLRSIIIRVLGIEADKGPATENMENNLRMEQ
ncbi:hypothetical protein BB560_005600 [Smittium megazygosporum]|uniref:SAM-dependent MTase RsmB/NOP-type domain-containing protein n=1 Tax=Smittium megazygosporum TaxID=133381 RepID=A0A2T9Z2K9_9FUNG|nr:hypothetical protein BB560_005600 [Smittium megazygosporum]